MDEAFEGEGGDLHNVHHPTVDLDQSTPICCGTVAKHVFGHVKEPSRRRQTGQGRRTAVKNEKIIISLIVFFQCSVFTEFLNRWSISFDNNLWNPSFLALIVSIVWYELFGTWTIDTYRRGGK